MAEYAFLLSFVVVVVAGAALLFGQALAAAYAGFSGAFAN